MLLISLCQISSSHSSTSSLFRFSIEVKQVEHTNPSNKVCEIIKAALNMDYGFHG